MGLTIKILLIVFNDVRLIVVLLAGFLCFFQMACEEKPKAINTQAEIQKGYKKFLEKKWIDLNSHEEWLLKTCLGKDSEGGATVVELKYQDREADKMVTNNLLAWDSDNRKYKVTQMGKDVYEVGMKIREEEAKKDPRMRSERISKEAAQQ